MKQTKIHIIAIIEGMIVYKWYARHKRVWRYQIQGPWFFEYLYKRGQLIKL